ncbi:hypothetical protein ACFJGW_03970 [Burkholderiaceae bacterium UC74_6]
MKKTILSRSLVLAFATAAVSMATVPAAYAQSTTVGSVFGQITARSGDQVAVENTATGLKRSAPVAADGQFQLVALPPGQYNATLLKGGQVVSSVKLVVMAAQNVEVTFGSGAATQLDTVQVVGKVKTIDVKSSENGSTFTSRQLESLPVATKDLNGIIALAANTTVADSRYAGGISIGGGAPSENAYYINGFPVTNALTQLGSIELPYGAISQADVKTGGFGAEFGRSVGGVVNITTKSGTNDWHGGVSLSVEPDALRSLPKSIYYPNTGSNPTTDGKIYLDNSKESRSRYIYGVNVGGPIIQDKLFFFLAADFTRTATSGVNATPQSSVLSSAGWADQQDKNTRYLGKFDWNITDDHVLELTLLGDNYKTQKDYSGYNYATGQKTGYVYSEFAKNEASVTPAVGGEAQILKYTGNLTGDLTLTALYGQSKSKHADSYSFAPTAPSVGWTSTGRNPNFTYVDSTKAINPLPFATLIVPEGSYDNTKSFRLDVEYRGIKGHTIRAGLDENRLRSTNAGQVVAGGSSWQYARTDKATFTGLGGTQAISTLTPGIVDPTDGKTYYYYARQYIFNDATGAQSNQSAQYIEDQIKVTRNLLVTAGLRNEGFVNKNGDGQTFLESKNFFSPRFAAAWDVNGDASMKVYGSAGRYSLQIPTHVAVRGASRSTYTNQYFAYTGVDPVTGLPTGTTATGPATSSNNEYGQPKDVKTVSALDIKPTYQDEITLGMEKALSSEYTFGVKGTYRKLRQTIDDLCDTRPFIAYAKANGINYSNYGGGCASFNPGKANSFLVDYAGNGTYTRVDLSAADLGFDKAKRTYIALDFSLEHALRNNWYGKLTYTYSRSRGNTEGQTRSDNAQTDVAATSSWDHPELMVGAYGNLPNDRPHQIKAYGFYQFSQEWSLGANFRAEAGRPKNCFGNWNGPRNATFDNEIDYGNVYFYCNGVATPRGSLGRLPWQYNVDMNLSYKPASVKGLALRVDVFNLFDRQTASVIDETREVSYDTTVLPTYGRVISYTAPRAVRLTATYDF